MELSADSIQYHRRAHITNAVYSIIIPTWNNLPLLQLCIDSIRDNSQYRHQIILHINEGTDGTLDWVNNQPDIDYTYSRQNIGVCYALNAARGLMTTDYLLYLNDDMYVCPGWDRALHQEILQIGHNYFFISATAIEPVPQSKCSISGNYGRTAADFNREKLLMEFDKLPMSDWQGATWPPNIIHKDVWDMVGGYSVEFSPGMYSDPDFSMKLWQLGIRLFKGIGKSRVYHFGSVSTKRIKKNKGYYRFISKWGMTSSTLTKYYLRRGEKFDGVLSEPSLPVSVNVKNFFKRLQNIFLLGLLFIFSCNTPGKENKPVANKNAIDSILHDTAFDYYANGRIKGITPLTNNLRNGFVKSFDSAGNCTYSGYYYYELAVGPVFFYNSGGRLQTYIFYDLHHEKILRIDYANWKGIEDVVGRSIRFTNNPVWVDSTEQVDLLLYLINPPKISFSYSIYKKKKEVDTGYVEVQKLESDLPFFQGQFPLLPKDEHYWIGLRIHDSILNRNAIVYKEL